MRGLDEFRQPFQQFIDKLLHSVLPQGERAHLLTDVQLAQSEAERLATQDRVTYALNRRGVFWYVSAQAIRSVAKIDMYDMRQANKVYGVAAVDSDLRRLSYKLRQMFPHSAGSYVRRSAGSDEFFVLSIQQSVRQLQRAMHRLSREDHSESLLPWDYGVGATELAADTDLQERRRAIRPAIIRQIGPDNHSEIPRISLPDETTPEWLEFRQSYQILEQHLRSSSLSDSSIDSLLHDLRNLQVHAENEITADDLTDALNWIGRKWYIGLKPVQAVALTDMHNMHEGNLRFGAAAIDQDLRRFSNVLLNMFPREDGYLVLRSQKAGDEFQVASLVDGPEALHKRFHELHQLDQSAGLLAWHYGVGHDEADALHQLYANIVQPTVGYAVRSEHIAASEVRKRRSYYLVAKPQDRDRIQVQQFASQVATALNGQLIEDLHCTLQAITWEGSAELLSRNIETYTRRLKQFDIEFQQVARVSIANLPGRIWLMARKSPELETIYRDIAQLGVQLHFQSYSYPLDDWRPHMKLVVLPSDAPPIDAQSIYAQAIDIRFRVRSVTLTCQIASHEWYDVAEFAIR